MTFRGEIHNGTVVLDAPVLLPEGCRVEVAVMPLIAGGTPPPSPMSPPSLPDDERPVWERIAELAKHVPEEALRDLPMDGASELDHYLYGAPKRGT
jgi:hypothetical protein